MTAAWLQTAGDIVNAVAVDVGLDEASDPFASSDRAFVRLCSLLNGAGQELCLSRDWAALTRQGTFTGTGATTEFDLPDDFGRMKDNTAWDRAGMSILAGPLSSQHWQYLQAWTSSASVNLPFRIVRDKFQVYQDPGNGVVLYYEYQSRWWVQANGQSSGNKTSATASNDTVLLDPLLVQRLLKCKWLEAIGEDSTAARQEFAVAFDGAASNEPAPTLNMAHPFQRGRFIDSSNIPDTGFGS